MADFKKLDVWQKARELTINTIRASESMSGSTGSLIRGQLIRATMSVPANIAEGSAKQSDREFARYVRIALGSTTESANHLILLRDLGAIDDRRFAFLDSSLDEIGRMLTGLEKRLRDDAGEQ